MFEGVAEHMPPYDSVEDIGMFFSFLFTPSFTIPIPIPPSPPYPPSHPSLSHMSHRRFRPILFSLIPPSLSGLIVIANIARTYSPYITPNTRSAPPTAELRRILLEQAVQMLAVFLGKWKRVRGEGEGAGFEVLTVRLSLPVLPSSLPSTPPLVSSHLTSP